jgi:hypothetical protein
MGEAREIREPEGMGAVAATFIAGVEFITHLDYYE